MVEAMKVCPICRTEFSDDAEFCPKCKAALLEKEDDAKAPFEGKRLAIAIVSTCAFMLIVAGIYMLIKMLMN